MRKKLAKPSKKMPSRNRSVVVPKEFGGKWIAWNCDRSAILGSGETLNEAQAAARASDEADLGFEWIPPGAKKPDPYADMIGVFHSGRKDGAANHDKYLKRDKRESS